MKIVEAQRRERLLLQLSQKSMTKKKIESALISVYHKEGLAPIIEKLHDLGVKLISTGGTEAFIRDQGLSVQGVEEFTDYPSIFGGRVKTLHPSIFGGILYRRDHQGDGDERSQYKIPSIDLVIVDLYPFEETVASGASEQDIIEKIDIGGISLIRAAAKNYKDVLIVSDRKYYPDLLALLEAGGTSTEETRKLFAARAFDTSSHYDTHIFNHFNKEAQVPAHKLSFSGKKELRYGENPHQQGAFFGDFEAYFEQLQGKDISYNNLIDIEAATHLISEFADETAFAILKHNNACGLAVDENLSVAYEKAFAADTLSAFGGVLVTNQEIDEATATKMNSLFFEIAIAPSFSTKALEILQTKKNRILLVQKQPFEGGTSQRSMMNGLMVQQGDWKTDQAEDLKVPTQKKPSQEEISDLLFASKICKHTKSNAIVLSKNNQLLASGVGQTSRVDALHQAIEKAGRFGFTLDGAVMASDAFFPFPDCVEIARNAGIKAVIQPGGSIKDNLSIDFCDGNDMTMVFTGFRHFKH